ncbi:MAG: hypothetical protein JST92_14485 [Deltaproteobacteria bacterium]|nr:hypothetical protein [Deltaproteobacteria bacterium]
MHWLVDISTVRTEISHVPPRETDPMTTDQTFFLPDEVPVHGVGYSLVAVSAAGAKSHPSKVRYPPTPAAAVTVTASPSTPSGFVVRWTGIDAAAVFFQQGAQAPTSTSCVSPCLYTQLAPATTYTIWVEAISDSGTFWSDSTQATTLPGAPTQLRATPAVNSALIEWSPADGADGYTVESFDGTITSQATTGTSATIPCIRHLPCNVIVMSQRGTLAGGSAQIAASQLEPPPAPTGYQLLLDLPGAHLSWNAAPTATGYRIDGVPGGPVTTSSTSYDVAAVPTNRQLGFYVSSINAAGVGNPTGSGVFVPGTFDTERLGSAGSTAAVLGPTSSEVSETFTIHGEGALDCAELGVLTGIYSHLGSVWLGGVLGLDQRTVSSAFTDGPTRLEHSFVEGTWFDFSGDDLYLTPGARVRLGVSGALTKALLDPVSDATGTYEVLGVSHADADLLGRLALRAAATSTPWIKSANIDGQLALAWNGVPGARAYRVVDTADDTALTQGPEQSAMLVGPLTADLRVDALDGAGAVLETLAFKNPSWQGADVLAAQNFALASTSVLVWTAAPPDAPAHAESLTQTFVAHAGGVAVALDVFVVGGPGYSTSSAKWFSASLQDDTGTELANKSAWVPEPGTIPPLGPLFVGQPQFFGFYPAGSGPTLVAGRTYRLVITSQGPLQVATSPGGDLVFRMHVVLP